MFVPTQICDVPEDVITWFEDLKIRENECIGVLCLDDEMKVLSKKIVANGDAAGVHGTKKGLWAEILSNPNIDGFFLVHNHPGNATYPSEIDNELTRNCYTIAKILNITMYDHLIITPTSYYSYCEKGYIIEMQ